MPWVLEYLGKERAHYLYAFKTMQDNGLILGGSSDAPIEDVNPLHGIHTLVTRPGGGGVSNEAGGLRRFDPSTRYTVNPGEYAYKADRSGRITTGYYADFAVFDRHVMQVDADALLEARVTRTVIDGDTVYQVNERGNQYDT